MDVLVKPGTLEGTIRVPDSKSDLHRKLIASFLAGCLDFLDYDRDDACDDVKATEGALDALSFRTARTPILDCRESGSTLRFLIPLACTLFDAVEFTGTSSLFRRPVFPLLDAMSSNGVSSRLSDPCRLVLTGRLKAGTFVLPGNISSQFVSGLLFALPLLSGDSTILLTTPLESSDYVSMTLDVLSRFGIRIGMTSQGGLPVFFVPGLQKYIRPQNLCVEGDWSAAAYFIPFGVECVGLNRKSLQCDRRILELVPMIFEGKSIDVSNCPDLFPVLSVLNCKAGGIAKFANCDRLRLKESDRIESVDALVKSIGGCSLTGGEVDGCCDHRIVMAAAVASCIVSGDILIRGADAVKKSYPQFWRDFKMLGGSYVVYDR